MLHYWRRGDERRVICHSWRRRAPIWIYEEAEILRVVRNVTGFRLVPKYVICNPSILITILRFLELYVDVPL